MRGTFLAIQACIPHLKQSANGHILSLSPPINLDPAWLGGHAAYTLSKYGMTLVTLCAAEELREAGVAANTLWPRTIIATAAVQNLLGGDEAMSRARTPQIYADSAYEILIKPSREYTGQSLIDDEVLAAAGVTDLEPYRAGRATGSSSATCSSTPPRCAERAQHGRDGRARVGVLVDLDPLDPLDPLEAAPAGRDEPARRAVAVRERLVADARGQQQLARVLEPEAPAVAGARDHAHVARARLDARLVEHRPSRTPCQCWRARSRRCSRAWRSARRRGRARRARAPARAARGRTGDPVGRRRGSSATHDVLGKSLPVNEPAS